MKMGQTVVPQLRLFRPRKWGEKDEDFLKRVDKRLQQIQFELDNWITVPTTYGILITHKLEDEKQLFLKVKDLVLALLRNLSCCYFSSVLYCQLKKLLVGVELCRSGFLTIQHIQVTALLSLLSYPSLRRVRQ